MLRRHYKVSSAWLLLVGCTWIGLSACGLEGVDLADQQRGAPAPPVIAPAPPVIAPEPPVAAPEPPVAAEPFVTSDSEIAAVVSAINVGEIQQAEMALQNAQHPDVIEYAEEMLLLHGEAERRQSTLLARLRILPRQNPVSEAVAAEAEALLTSLREEAIVSFDRAYIHAQIAMHQRGLSLLDAQLLPRAQSAELRAELEKSRTEVADHLARAEEIASSLAR